MLDILLPEKCAMLVRRLCRDYLRGGYMGLDGVDRRLVQHIKPSRGRYFVELGAYDGVAQSNTYVLQRWFGWTGLHIEPNPLRANECIRNRGFGVAPKVRCAACVSPSYEGDFVTLIEAGLMSVAKGVHISDEKAETHARTGSAFVVGNPQPYEYHATAATLTSLLSDADAPSDIELLSLDVEGNEQAVLEGIDFSRFSFRWILVETRGEESFRRLLANRGYAQVADLTRSDTRTDTLYKLESAVKYR